MRSRRELVLFFRGQVVGLGGSQYAGEVKEQSGKSQLNVADAADSRWAVGCIWSSSTLTMTSGGVLTRYLAASVRAIAPPWC